MISVISEFKDEYAFLSNFYRSPIVLPGNEIAPTLEHGYQAYKCVKDYDFRHVLAAATPSEAKRLGQQVRLRLDWEAAKIKLMRWLLTLKFSDCDGLGYQLLCTENVMLVEGNSWGDHFWGACDNVGENWLGHLLMARRAELRAIVIEKGEVT